MDCLCYHLFYLALVGDVGNHGHSIAAQGVNLRSDGLNLFKMARCQHDGGAFLRKGEGNRPAYPSAATGDNGHFIR